MADYTSQIDEFLKKKGSPMAGLGSLFTGAGRKYGVDPRLVVAISGIESSFGKHTYGAHNAWGWGPGKPFSSWEHGITEVTRGLRQGYLNRGLKTPEQIVNRYAPASDGNDTGRWANVVNQFLGELGATVPTTKQPTRKEMSAGQPVPPTPTAVPGFDPLQNLRAAAMENLSSFASGKFIKPTEQLAALAHGASLDQQAERQAQMWGGTTIPRDATAELPAQGARSNAMQTTARAGGKVERALQIAKAQIGKPYVFGAVGPKAFDCSGLIEYAFEQAGIPTPGRMTTGTAIHMGRDVTGLPMEPGDWLVKHDPRGQQHMVMYVGNGQVIAAPHTGEVVQYQDADKFRGAGWRVRRYP